MTTTKYMSIKFPKRSHVGCDPMCDECQEWLHTVKEKTKPATAEAIKAFWNVVEAVIPEADSRIFENWLNGYEILEEEVGLLVAECLPKPDAIFVGNQQKVVKKFEPASTQPQPDAIWLPFD